MVVSQVGFLILDQTQPKLLHLNAFYIKVMAKTNVLLVFNYITKLAKHCLMLGLGSPPKESYCLRYLSLPKLVDETMLFMEMKVSE